MPQSEQQYGRHTYPKPFTWPHEHLNTPERNVCGYCGRSWERRDEPCVSVLRSDPETVLAELRRQAGQARTADARSRLHDAFNPSSQTVDLERQIVAHLEAHPHLKDSLP